MVILTFLKKFNISLPINNVRSNKTEMLLDSLISLYEHRILNGGYVIKINSIVEYSLGFVRNGVVDYTVIAVIDILSLYAGSIIRNCTIESIETDGKMVFLSKFGKDKIKIILDAVDSDMSEFKIGNQIGIRIVKTNTTYMSTFAEVLAIPINPYIQDWTIHGSLHVLLKKRYIYDNDITMSIDNINAINTIRKNVININNDSWKTIYQIKGDINNPKLIKQELSEINKILTSFYGPIDITKKIGKITRKTFERIQIPSDLGVDELFGGGEDNKHVFIYERLNIFEKNFNITDTQSDEVMINYIIPYVSYMNGIVYRLFSVSNVDSKITEKTNESVRIQFYNKLIYKILQTLDDELYVNENSLNWSKHTKKIKKQYTELFG